MRSRLGPHGAAGRAALGCADCWPYCPRGARPPHGGALGRKVRTRRLCHRARMHRHPTPRPRRL
eukprot:4361067-Prymnesium_polylepis.1